MTIKEKTKVRRSTPFDQWPATDQELWIKACAPVSLFDDEGNGFRHLADISRKKYSFGWGCWITFLAAYAPDDLKLSPAERCSKGNVQAYIDYMRSNGNADRTIINRLIDLAMVTRALDTSFNPRFLNRAMAVLQSKAKPVRSKVHIPRTDALVDLGFRLMASALDLNKLDGAVTFRDGLLIAFLALHPVRLRNLINFQLDKNLIRHSDGFVVVLRSSETKTGSVYEVPLADVLVEPMEKYLTVCRPVLVAARGERKGYVGTGVWISSHASPMSRGNLQEHIKMRTQVAFGKSISPHNFRDAAATTLVVADPARVQAAASLLGHRTLATTERFYVQAKGLEAQRSYLDFLEALKKERRRD